MEDTVDLVVIGSGAAGMCAAVTAASRRLTVAVLERAPVLGGTTAWSGGWMWLPRNPLAIAAGIMEPAEVPRDYLKAVVGNRFDGARVDAFLEAAPAMVDHLQSLGMAFEAGNAICDIYGDQPGAGTGGRSLIAAPLDARVLGKHIRLLRETKRETSLWGMPIQAGADLAAFQHATRSPRAFAHAARRMTRHLFDKAVHGRSMQLRNGAALTARLFAIGQRLGVRWLPATEAVELVSRNGRVIGVRLWGAAGESLIGTRAGVVLACGGFSQDAGLRADHFPHPSDHVSLAVPEADGAALRLARPLGARFDTSLAANGAWCPVSRLTWPDGSRGVFPHIVERGKPGIIAVTANGRRFVNEADGYHDYVNALHAATTKGQPARSWLVCDHRFLRRWGLGMVKPFPFPIGHWLRSGYLKRADTIEGLARACGIDPALAETVEAYNDDAARGMDSAFRRGWSPYNRKQGDPDHHPNPNVAPIEDGPFYAVEVVPGSFGSFAGLATDSHARVLDQAGQPIPGLFAAGTDAASIMGGTYPAGGINLGPAMVFGWIAANTAAQSAQ